MKKSKLTAVTLQRLFLVGIFLLIISAVLGFIALGKVLESKALQVNHAQTDASIGSDNVKQLEQLNKDLKTHSDTVKRAKEIVADSKSYQYQDQIVQDINSFADRVGITVLGYNFTDNEDGSTSANPTSGATGTTTSPTPGSGAPGAITPSTSTPPGIKTVTANITLKNPVPYTSFLKFLKLIEQNVTKMQVTGVSLTPDAEHPGQISNPTIGLIVYVR